MNEFRIFSNPQFENIRTVTKDGKPWFVVADVCAHFGVSNRNRAMQQIDANDKGGTQIATPGGTQTVSIVNEAGLYSLLLALQPTKARGVSDEYIARRCAELKAFKHWVFHDVLPSIRKHGAYVVEDLLDRIIDDPDLGIRLFTEAKARREQRRMASENSTPQAYLSQEMRPKLAHGTQVPRLTEKSQEVTSHE